jgi:hypothetical protein
MTTRLEVMVSDTVARMDLEERQRYGSLDLDVKCYRDCDTVFTVNVAASSRTHAPGVCPKCGHNGPFPIIVNEKAYALPNCSRYRPVAS